MQRVYNKLENGKQLLNHLQNMSIFVFVACVVRLLWPQAFAQTYMVAQNQNNISNTHGGSKTTS